MPKINTKYIHAALLAVVALFLNACGHYPAINVKVVDAETSEPIEGAVLLSQWNIIEGIFGAASTKNYKVVEKISDKDGYIHISGPSNINLEHPRVTVYKKGYVAWNNRYIFPDYKKRSNFYWRDGYVFRLERFKPEYSHKQHVFFIDASFTTGVLYGPFIKSWEWEEQYSE